MGSWYSGNQQVYHLGAWTAPVGRHVHKLNFPSCVGFDMNAAVQSDGTMTARGPQIIDLTIYFYTSNGNATVGDRVTTGSGQIRGYGYAVSTHVTTDVYSVYVVQSSFNSTTLKATFDFYLVTGPFVGNPVLTAVTSQSWVPDTSGVGASNLTVLVPNLGSKGFMRLPQCTAMTSLCRTYTSSTTQY
jgi:hypothetical protein